MSLFLSWEQLTLDFKNKQKKGRKKKAKSHCPFREVSVLYLSDLRSHDTLEKQWNVWRNVTNYWYADSSVIAHPVSCPVESLDNIACDCRMFLWDEPYHWGIIALYCRLHCKRISIWSASEKVRHQLDSLAQCHSSCWPPIDDPKTCGDSSVLSVTSCSIF